MTMGNQVKIAYHILYVQSLLSEISSNLLKENDNFTFGQIRFVCLSGFWFLGMKFNDVTFFRLISDALFLNVTELSGQSQRFGQRLREAVEIALEQGDEDLLTVDVARLFLDKETEEMMDAFRRYCVRSVRNPPTSSPFLIVLK